MAIARSGLLSPQFVIPLRPKYTPLDTSVKNADVSLPRFPTNGPDSSPKGRIAFGLESGYAQALWQRWILRRPPRHLLGLLAAPVSLPPSGLLLLPAQSAAGGAESWILGDSPKCCARESSGISRRPGQARRIQYPISRIPSKGSLRRLLA